MKLWSDSWTNGDRIAERYAAGRARGGGRCGLFRQREPAPGLERFAGRHGVAGADLPRLRRAEQARRRQPARPRGPERSAAGRLLPLGAGRPAADRARDCRRRVQPRLHAPRQARPCRAARRTPGPQRLHRLVRRGRRSEPATTSATTAPSRRSTTRWCTTTCSRSTRWTLPRLPLEGVFTGPQVREAIAGHVLGAATHSGTYTLNRRLLG